MLTIIEKGHLIPCGPPFYRLSQPEIWEIHSGNLHLAKVEF